MAMPDRARHLRLSEQQRSDRLTTEIEEWKFRGYRVQARTATTVHLLKPRGGALWPVVGLLILCVGVNAFSGIVAAAAALAIGLILILAWQSGRRDDLVQLTVDPDGTVYKE